HVQKRHQRKRVSQELGSDDRHWNQPEHQHHSQKETSASVRIKTSPSEYLDQPNQKRNQQRRRYFHAEKQKVKVPGVAARCLRHFVDEQLVHHAVSVVSEQLFIDVSP